MRGPRLAAVVSAIERVLPFAAAAAGTGAAALSAVLWSGCPCAGATTAADKAAAIGTGLAFVLVGLIAWLRPGGRRVGS